MFAHPSNPSVPTIVYLGVCHNPAYDASFQPQTDLSCNLLMFSYSNSAFERLKVFACISVTLHSEYKCADITEYCKKKNSSAIIMNYIDCEFHYIKRLTSVELIDCMRTHAESAICLPSLPQGLTKFNLLASLHEVRSAIIKSCCL